MRKIMSFAAGLAAAQMAESSMHLMRTAEVVPTRRSRRDSGYMPHQGSRECARRLRQMQKAKAKMEEEGA